MNRNTEAHFSQLPTLEISRSKFDMGHTHITTLNASELVPIYVDPDIIPGDTVTMRMSDIIRMMTPIAPVMDNAFADFYFFFVPNRLVQDNWVKVMGEIDVNPWSTPNNYSVPQIKISNKYKNGTLNKLTSTVEKGSVLNHMGIPLQEAWTYDENETKLIEISSLPTKAYCLIWNEFFRDENLQNPVNVTTSDSSHYVYNSKISAYISDPETAIVQNEQYGGLPCLKVCKPHDYFTSALPGPQKGPAVSIPLTEDRAPVLFGKYYDSTDGEWKTNQNWTNYTTMVDTSTGEFNGLPYDDWEDDTPPADGPTSTYSLYTDLTKVTGATVTALRQCFAIQKFYERDARGGTRYIESIWSHFRVRNPDYRLQRPEYLGGFRQNLNMNQVVQNSATVEDQTPLGTTGAYSVTSGQQNDLFSHSFTEHGCLIGLVCIRTEHSYCQGINRSWFKKSRLDFYSPEFANLSEQAILNREIYAQGTSDDTEAFGYQEAWAEMRYKPNILTGEMDLTLSDTLGGIWTYGDKYDELPRLGNKWIKETKDNINRTLAIQDHDQFLCDFYFAPIYTRPLPLYSVPGLIDHH